MVMSVIKARGAYWTECCAEAWKTVTYIHVDIQHDDLGKDFWVELHGRLIILLNVFLPDILRYPGLQQCSYSFSTHCDTC